MPLTTKPKTCVLRNKEMDQPTKLLLRLNSQRTELRGAHILSVMMRHYPAHSRYVNSEPRAGKADQTWGFGYHSSKNANL